MKKYLEEWCQQHAKIQILCRTGLGVEGNLLDVEDDWITIKQANGVTTLVCYADVSMIHKVTEIQVLRKEMKPLQIS